MSFRNQEATRIRFEAVALISGPFAKPTWITIELPPALHSASIKIRAVVKSPQNQADAASDQDTMEILTLTGTGPFRVLTSDEIAAIGPFGSISISTTISPPVGDEVWLHGSD